MSKIEKRLIYQLDVTRTPGFGEEGFERAIQAEAGEEAFVGAFEKAKSAASGLVICPYFEF